MEDTFGVTALPGPAFFSTNFGHQIVRSSPINLDFSCLSETTDLGTVDLGLAAFRSLGCIASSQSEQHVRSRISQHQGFDEQGFSAKSFTTPSSLNFVNLQQRNSQPPASMSASNNTNEQIGSQSASLLADQSHGSDGCHSIRQYSKVPNYHNLPLAYNNNNNNSNENINNNSNHQQNSSANSDVQPSCKVEHSNVAIQPSNGYTTTPFGSNTYSLKPDGRKRAAFVAATPIEYHSTNQTTTSKNSSSSSSSNGMIALGTLCPNQQSVACNSFYSNPQYSHTNHQLFATIDPSILQTSSSTTVSDSLDTDSNLENNLATDSKCTINPTAPDAASNSLARSNKFPTSSSFKRCRKSKQLDDQGVASPSDFESKADIVSYVEYKLETMEESFTFKSTTYQTHLKRFLPKPDEKHRKYIERIDSFPRIPTSHSERRELISLRRVEHGMTPDSRLGNGDGMTIKERLDEILTSLVNKIMFLLVVKFDTWYIHAPAREQIRERLLEFIWPHLPELQAFFREHFTLFIDMRIRHFRDSVARYFRDRPRTETKSAMLNLSQSPPSQRNVQGRLHSHNGGYTKYSFGTGNQNMSLPSVGYASSSSPLNAINNEHFSVFDYGYLKPIPTTTYGYSLNSSFPPHRDGGSIAASSPVLPTSSDLASHFTSQNNLPPYQQPYVPLTVRQSSQSLLPSTNNNDIYCSDRQHDDPMHLAGTPLLSYNTTEVNCETRQSIYGSSKSKTQHLPVTLHKSSEQSGGTSESPGSSQQSDTINHDNSTPTATSTAAPSTTTTSFLNDRNQTQQHCSPSTNSHSDLRSLTTVTENNVESGAGLPAMQLSYLFPSVLSQTTITSKEEHKILGPADRLSFPPNGIELKIPVRKDMMNRDRSSSLPVDSSKKQLIQCTPSLANSPSTTDGASLDDDPLVSDPLIKCSYQQQPILMFAMSQDIPQKQRFREFFRNEFLDSTSHFIDSIPPLMPMTAAAISNTSCARDDKCKYGSTDISSNNTFLTAIKNPE